MGNEPYACAPVAHRLLIGFNSCLVYAEFYRFLKFSGLEVDASDSDLEGREGHRLQLVANSSSDPVMNHL